MRKSVLWVVLLIGTLLVWPAAAQEGAGDSGNDYDCTTVGINRQADNWYNDYLGARGEFEVGQALEALAELGANLTDLAETCGFAAASGPEDEVEQTGIGTPDSPFIIQAPGVVGQTTIDISEGVRPANDLLIEADVSGADAPQPNREFVVVFLTVECAPDATGGC